jgi:hypothetical protein
MDLRIQLHELNATSMAPVRERNRSSGGLSRLYRMLVHRTCTIGELAKKKGFPNIRKPFCINRILVAGVGFEPTTSGL